MDRKKMRVATERMEGKDLRTSSESITHSPTTPTTHTPTIPPDTNTLFHEDEHILVDNDTSLHISSASLLPPVPMITLVPPTPPIPPPPPAPPRSSSPPPKRKKTSHHTPKDDLILPEGWTTNTTTRKSGKSAGRVVPHWISPEGKKFRSKAAIKEFLAKTNPNPPPLNLNSDQLSSIPPPSSPSELSSQQTPNPAFPPLPSLSGNELPSSVLTPLGEEDKIFGMNVIHQRDNNSYKHINPLDDDDDHLLSTTPTTTTSPLAGFINTHFNGVLPQLQTVGFCRISGHLDGLGLLTQITIGDKSFRGFVMSEDFASVSPSSSPSPAFPLETYAEVEKHIQACQDIFFDDVAARNKALGIDLSSVNVAKLNGHTPTTNNLHNANNTLHALHPSINSMLHSSLQPNGHNHNHNHNTFNDLELDEDEDDDHLTLNSHLTSHLTSNGNGNHHPSHHHPNHNTHRNAGSNSSTDTEEGLGAVYNLNKEPSHIVYDDPDTFLATSPHTHTPKSHHTDFLNGASNHSNGTHNDIDNDNDNIDAMDVIADDMPTELDITKHTQDAPMLKQVHVGGLLNTHMLIGPRHMMGV